MHITKHLFLALSVIALVSSCGLPFRSSSSATSGSESSSRSSSRSESTKSSSTKSSSTKSSSSSSSKSSSSRVVDVTGVSISNDAITLEEGQTKNLYAYIDPSNATDKRVIWSSSDSDIASVSTSGKVTAHKAGLAVITVMTNDGGYKAKCEVTVVEKERFDYEIGETSCEVYVKETAYFSSTYIRACTPIKNTGNVNIYLSTCSYDIYSANNVPIKSFSTFYITETPDLIAPGETGYYTLNATYDEEETEGLIAKIHPTIKNAKSKKIVRYEISQMSFVQDSSYGITAKGVVTNNTDKTADSLDYIHVVLFGAEDKYLFTLETTLGADLQPGESTIFEADTLYGGSTITESDITRYEAFAYSWTIVI